MIIPHRRSKNNKADLAEQSSKEHSLRILTKEEHNLMGISRSRKDDKSAVSVGGRGHNFEEDPQCNMATAEIKVKSNELSQPSCPGSVKKAAEDESYLLNISKFGKSCVCVSIQ